MKEENDLMKMSYYKKPKESVYDSYENALFYKYNNTSMKNKLQIAVESLVLSTSEIRFTSTFLNSEIVDFARNATELDILKIEAIMDSTFGLLIGEINKIKNNKLWHNISLVPIQSVIGKGYDVKLQSKNIGESKFDTLVSLRVPSSSYGPLGSDLHVASAFIIAAYQLKHTL